MSQIQKPIIHLNGTSATALAEQYSDAANAVVAAIARVYENGPHPRDYYVSPDAPAAWRRAIDEHQQRVASLELVAKQLEELRDHALALIR